MFPQSESSLLAMTEAPRTAAEFVDWLVVRHPLLRPILEEHLSDNFSELLPHVLFGDVTRYAADLARRAADEPEAEEELRLLLADLDAAMLPEPADDPVDNLIWTSFVENAQGLAGDSQEALRDRLRAFPNLVRVLSHYE
jgi:hypothetical protein